MKRLKALWIASPFVILFALLSLMGIGMEPVSANEWHTETVDTKGDVGLFTSLALDPITGYPRISYFDLTNRDLKYAFLLPINQSPLNTGITVPADPVPVNVEGQCQWNSHLSGHS